MAGLNFADIFETVVDTTPEAAALVVRSAEGDDVRLTFAELDARVNRLAHALLAHGVGPGDHVGCHLYDGNQYVETTLAAFKVRAVPVNVNFRYVDEELEYLFDNADLKLVVTEPDLEARAERAAKDLAWDCPVVVADDRYEALLAVHPDTRPVVADRGPDDLYGLWTGGTTGMPKGVMWRHEDIYLSVVGGGGNAALGCRPGGRPRRRGGPGGGRLPDSRGTDAVPADARRRLVDRLFRTVCRVPTTSSSATSGSIRSSPSGSSPRRRCGW